MSDVHVITHGGCADGHTAAWLLRDYYAEGNFDVAFHASEDRINPPEVTLSSDVIIADYSFPREKLIELAKIAGHVYVLDHHKTAEADLKGIQDEVKNITVIFDMERSGARIVWDWIGSPVYCEGLVKYVEDRDLWRKRKYMSDEYAAVIAATEFTFDAWDDLNDKIRRRPELIQAEGAAILAKDNKVIESIVETARPMTVGGHEVLAVASPYAYGSEVAGRLAERNDIAFGVYYIDRKDGRQFGLRSRSDQGEGFDTSEVAKSFGGGGHHNASGFTVPWGHKLAPADVAA